MPRNPQRSEDQHTEVFFHTTFAARVRGVAEARRAFAAWLRDRTADEDTRAELAVVMSELAANAVAGSPDPSAAVDVSARADGDHVLLEVVNVTDGTPVATRWDLDDPLRGGGRGLLIVRALVDSVDVVQDAGGRIVVRCCRRLGPPADVSAR